MVLLVSALCTSPAFTVLDVPFGQGGLAERALLDVAEAVAAAEAAGGAAAGAGAAGLSNGRAAKVVARAVLGVAGRAVDGRGGEALLVRGFELEDVELGAGLDVLDVDGGPVIAHDAGLPVAEGGGGDEDGKDAEDGELHVEGIQGWVAFFLEVCVCEI